MPSNISGRSNTTVYVNTVSCDLPLNLITNNSSSSTINLGGLSSYGGSGKIIKVNSNNDGLEYATESAAYTVVSPLTISNNAISLSNLTNFGGAGKILKVNSSNNAFEYVNETDTTYSGGTNIGINGTTINLDSTITIDRLNITQGNSIFLKGNEDVNHYIKYVFDGIEIGGFGSNEAPCFQVVNTKPLDDTPVGTPIVVFQVYRDKIISKQNLNMTSKPIYYKENDINHYITYQSTGDCLELASYSDGADDDVVFQFINKAVAQDNNLVLFNKENNSFVKTTNFQSDVYIKNAKKLIFNNSSVETQNNYIKFNDTYDSMEISGSGLGTGSSVLRIVSVNSTPDVLADFELTKTTFEKTTHFNNDIQMASEKKLFFDVGNNNWIKATTEDSQDGLHIQGSTGIKLSTGTYPSELFLNKNTFEVSVNLTTFYNNITATNCDISLEGDFTGTNCNLTIDGDMRVGKELNMRDENNLGQINMAGGTIYWRNGYITETGSYVTDTNHFSQYNGWPVDGIRHQGWNGVALGYTNGGPGTALYTDGTSVKLGNGTAVTSDDRIKFNESKITDALSTINKLVVMKYDKKYNRELYETQYEEEMENHLLNDTAKKEYGYIAQDTWNNIPELRFTIDGVDETIPENFDEDGKLIEDCKIRNKNQEGDEFIDRKYLSIDYNNINVLNVRAVQELYEIVRQQQEQINSLLTSKV